MWKFDLVKSLLALVAIFLVGFVFYWYSYRPTQARKECFESASEYVKKNVGEKGTYQEFNNAYDLFYKNCLRKAGLSP